MKLGVQGTEVFLSVLFEAGGEIQLGVCLTKSLDTPLTGRFEQRLLLGEGVPYIADAVEFGALPDQKPHPQLEPVGELGEVLGPDQHVDEADVAALVHPGSPVLKTGLSLPKIRLGDGEILGSRVYLSVELSKLEHCIAVRLVCSTRIHAQCRKPLLCLPNLIFFGLCLGRSAGCKPEYEYRAYHKT